MTHSRQPDRPPFYFSVDFEDIGADMLRFLGIDKTAAARKDKLWRSYEDIKSFAEKSLDGRPITFFCTGVLGVYAKDLIAKIARDGNEIACHYHFHDAVFKDSPDVMDRRLSEAIDALESASNSKVVGFRAPMFSVRREHSEHYRKIARRFRYDSSIIANARCPFDESSYADITNDGDLKLFPVPMIRKLNKICHKAGGTFFKLFPIEWTVDALSTAHQNGLSPVFYMHPYEFSDDRRFMLSRSDLRPLGFVRQNYWWARQAQWHSVGNSQAMSKLESLARKFAHQGNMRDLLAT